MLLLYHYHYYHYYFPGIRLLRTCAGRRQVSVRRCAAATAAAPPPAAAAEPPARLGAAQPVMLCRSGTRGERSALNSYFEAFFALDFYGTREAWQRSASAELRAFAFL